MDEAAHPGPGGTGQAASRGGSVGSACSTGTSGTTHFHCAEPQTETLNPCQLPCCEFTAERFRLFAAKRVRGC